MNAPRWSRRRWIAEHFGCDLSEVEDYQSTRRRNLVFQYGGRIVAVVLGEHDRAKVVAALGDYFEGGGRVDEIVHWKDVDVRLLVEKDGEA
mgnify:CR=1 FL=1